jgi:molecular chaperone DnaK
MGRIVGIDLGTTKSGISYINNGKPEIIEDISNNRIMPSVVHITDDNKIIVGQKAKRQAVLKPERTVTEIKRKMGQDILVRLGDSYYSPYEISSMIIKELKEYAENFLGEKVTEAVITVPANFNDLQRNATIKAGELAGLKIERIINEPTAAALAYGINNLGEERKVLVYDLGGGTFDVSIIDFYSGVMDVMASRGIQELGGKNFDELIANYILKDIYDTYGVDLKDDIVSMSRIIDEAEKAKIDLSYVQTTEILLPFIAVDEYNKSITCNFKFKRSKFEELISDIIDSTNDVLDEALNAAKLNDEDIDIVLAVGGSSRIPLVRNLLTKRFGNKIKTKINPDEAVALGVAIQAGIKKDEISSKDSIIITDICNNSLGIKVATDMGEGRYIFGLFDPLIRRDTNVPCTKKKIYTTFVDYQTEVIIDVYQGEEVLVEENKKIQEIILNEIPPALKGEQKIEITFSYNLNEILEVTAKILSTGKALTKIINLLDNSENSVEIGNLDVWKDSPSAKKVEKIICFCEKKLLDMNDKDKKDVMKILNNLKRAVIDNNLELIDKYDEELTNILFDLN